MTRETTTYHRWSQADTALLRQMYPDHAAAAVAAAIGCNRSSVYRMAMMLGLKKSEAFYASDLAGRIQRGMQLPSMIATRFKPGAVPWNAGTKGISGKHPNTVRTQFKAGRTAQEARNYVPIGALRVTRDGYLEKKVTDDPALYPSRRWIALHRLVWEAANGPIPQGHIVVFKPGQKTTVEAEVTIDRLECISRGENARRNHPRTKSPELAQLVQLKGAITRQVNRIIREGQK